MRRATQDPQGAAVLAIQGGRENPPVLHECVRFGDDALTPHHPLDNADVIRYGPAVYRCWSELNGSLWVEGGSCGSEYGNRVDFCPYCGVKGV